MAARPAQGHNSTRRLKKIRAAAEKVRTRIGPSRGGKTRKARRKKR